MVYFCFTVLLLFSDGNKIITGCDGSRKYGSRIYIDFFKISRPCTCNALSSFNGLLFITSAPEYINFNCGTQIQLKDFNNETLLFGCPILSSASNAFNVQTNQPVEIRADYVSQSSPGTFYHCLGFQQNGKYVYIQKLTFIKNKMIIDKKKNEIGFCCYFVI